MFFTWAKSKYPNLHIAWGFRGKDAQDRFLAQGKSRDAWPFSKHNNMINGKPCSLAIDLFQIDDNDKAVFDKNFYEMLYEEARASDFMIAWGGDFKKFPDYDHFQVITGPMVKQS